MSVMLVCGLKKDMKNLYTLNREKAVLTMGSTSCLYINFWEIITTYRFMIADCPMFTDIKTCATTMA